MRSFPKPLSLEPDNNNLEPDNNSLEPDNNSFERTHSHFELAPATAVLRGYLLRKKPGAAALPAVKTPGQSQVDAKAAEKPRRARRRLLCARCRAPITRESARCQINGDSEHRCLNPAGVYYHIHCFREASGCRVDGVPTEEYSWFPGYCWQLACCNRCSAHLGWFFSVASPVFFGLIRNCLVTGRE